MSDNKLTWWDRSKSWAAKQLGFATPRRYLGDSWMQFFDRPVVYNTWNTEKYISDGFTKNATLYSIVNRITSVSAVAAETFRVYKIKNQAKAARYKAWTGERATKESALMALRLKDEAYEVDDAHPFNNLLEKPNEWQGMNEFLQMSVGFKLLSGNRYLFLATPGLGANAKVPTAIYNLPPQHMVIQPGNTMWTVAGYTLTGGPTDVPIPAELVVHSRYWNPCFDFNGSHLYGLSPIEAAARRLDISKRAEDRSSAMMQNAGAAGVLFNKDPQAATLSEEQEAAMNKALNEKILGIQNSGKISLANGDLGFLQFGMKAADLEIIEQEKYTDDKLCNIYKVPPGLFQSSANATDNNIREWNKQLVVQACIPALADVRDDLNKILVNAFGQGYYVDYDVNIFPDMQEDQGKLAEILNKSWYLTGNEKRIIRGYDEDTAEPMMGRYLVPTSLADITTLNPDNMDEQLNEVDRQLQDQNEEG